MMFVTFNTAQILSLVAIDHSTVWGKCSNATYAKEYLSSSGSTSLTYSQVDHWRRETTRVSIKMRYVWVAGHEGV